MRPENRAWGFSRNGRALPLESSRRCQEPRRESRPTLTIFTPGIPQWPSCDPIEEEGGYNLYGFVDNNGIDYFDDLGQKMKPRLNTSPLSFNQRPCIQQITSGYPDYDRYEKPGQVYEECGGEPLAEFEDYRKAHGGFVHDSCALRVCMGINSSKIKIGYGGKRFLKDKNGNFNLLGAEELRSYIEKSWGKPDLKLVNDSELNWHDKMAGKCGIAFYLDVTWNAVHAGLYKDGEPYRDAHGGGIGRVMIWFVPCQCPLRSEWKCKSCKEAQKSEQIQPTNPKS